MSPCCLSRTTLLFFFVSFAGGNSAGATPLARTEPLEIRRVIPSADQVPVYGLFTLTLDFGATYENPFDPEQIDVYAGFFCEGCVQTPRVNGFLNQSCMRTLENGGEVIAPEGVPFWQIRFAPGVSGHWRYTVFVKDRTGEKQSAQGTFESIPASAPGHITPRFRGSPLFHHENGDPFIAIGENMCWSGPRGTYDYDEWLAALGNAGGNWIRVWMSPWHFGIEWSPKDQQPWDTSRFGGLGAYNLCNAWQLDTILDTAAKHNIQVMLCLGTYGEFTTGGYFGEGIWDSNPYNAANGGPCAKPEDFWTDQKARTLYKQRLRYLGARYGWRPNLFAWEFWNEAHAPAPWVQEMSRFLKGSGEEGASRPADAFDHLVSTTYGTTDVWQLSEVDFTMSHHYGQANLPDSAPHILADAREHRQFSKPHLMAEFGIDWRASDDKHDPGYLGINLHNGLWESLLSGNAGAAMIWYWDNYVHPGNLYPQFTRIRQFADRIPWKDGPWNALAIDRLETTDPTNPGYSDLVLTPAGAWEKPPDAPITIAGEEEENEGKKIPAFLYGDAKPELRTPIQFLVNYARPGRFAVNVGTVSIQMTFEITLDGKPAFSKTLSAQPVPEGAPAEYEQTEFRAEYGVHQAVFNKEYGIEVPAGIHLIALNASQGDWLSVTRYVLEGYARNNSLKTNRCGITNQARAYLWIQNPAHNWMNIRDGVSIPPLPESNVVIHGLQDGAYQWEWIDPWTGETLATTPCRCTENRLTTKTPPIVKDLAAAIEPAS